MLKQNFLYFTSGPLLPVLSLGINEKSFALSPPCIPMGIQTQFYLFQWKEMRKLCGMPGCLWCPAVHFQKKPWEYSLTLWYKNKRHCLAQAMSHKLLEAGTVHKYNCAWFAPVSSHRLRLLSSVRDRTSNETGFWHDLVHLLLLSKTFEKFQRDGCPPTGKKNCS